MNETRQASEAVTTSQTTAQSDVQGADIDNAGNLYQESGLDATQDTLRTSHLKAGNQHATNNLVARMLWGHEEKVNLNMRVSEDGSLDLNDDVR
ncbi:hypothetical protein [Sporomusa sphaeroides]|uniref:Uncharacterized protein n=1 Tax=Sporomusa sphaeroides DSM 2875 TaxID=1337886 RepID=A0ABM9W795_9FIRM|nr:hypothetical protein [Sporomusa sphaeroides]OLS57222.1 hypothetical protein SPSPH_07290 [Sporomusa sphaeroides DSM 2875]CVK20124.1 hypothetical protein SSPH_02791 [Sporomusa sphaeroides DSM 2875]